MKKFVAFSGGVESTTMALMFGHEATPIFADTGFEHREMYERLDFVEVRLREIHGPDFKIVRVRNEDETLPEYILRTKFYPSPVARFCTRIFKIEPMDEFLRNQGDCELMIGLNAQEAEKRTGNHGLLPNVHYGYPLVDLGITREDCIGVLKAHDLEPRLPVYMNRGGVSDASTRPRVSGRRWYTWHQTRWTNSSRSRGLFRTSEEGGMGLR